MKEKGGGSLFWHYVSEDRDLVFFAIGFLVWLLDLLAGLGGFKGDSWPWLVAEAAIPLSFAAGVGLYLRKYLRLTRQLASAKHLPVVFVAGKPWDEARQAMASAQEAVTRLTGFKAFHQMEEVFNVRWEYLIAHEKDRLPQDTQAWKDFIEDAERNILRFSDAVPGEKTYHVFVYGPASLALGLGAACGSKRRFVAYQAMDGQYAPVVNLIQGVRRIKQAAPEAHWRYIKVSYPARFTADLAVVLDMAAHPAKADARAYVSSRAPGMAIVEVGNTYTGNLAEADWVPVVQELFSVFQTVKSKEGVARLL